MTISFVSVICCFALLINMVRASEGNDIFADREASGEDKAAPHGLWATLAWFAGLLILSSLLGFILALAIFIVTFLRVRAGLGWQRTLLLSALGIAFMLGMATALNRDFPPGLLQSLIELPWPFR